MSAISTGVTSHAKKNSARLTSTPHDVLIASPIKPPDGLDDMMKKHWWGPAGGGGVLLK